jgi:hypothetical protein
MRLAHLLSAEEPDAPFNAAEWEQVPRQLSVIEDNHSGIKLG